jgi:putative transposase
MVNYRRNLLPGGTYFFTATLYNRHYHWLTEYIDELRHAFRKARNLHPFQIDAVVILPEHIHTIWTLPPSDADYPTRWKSLKAEFTRGLEKRGLPLSHRKDGSALVWQRRYWEHTIRNDTDLNHHIDYIHFNPVKHGLVERVAAWPYSSFHRYVHQGLLPTDWGGKDLIDAEVGEPIFDD